MTIRSLEQLKRSGMSNEAKEIVRAAFPKKRNKPATVIPDCMWEAFGIMPPVREYRFHPTRKWRIDFAWPDLKLAVEINGGVHSRGRHVRSVGYIKDMEKSNALERAGWKLLQYEPKKVDFEEIKNLMLSLYNQS